VNAEESEKVIFYDGDDEVDRQVKEEKRDNPLQIHNMNAN
jgi:hypothetical protein